MNKIFNYYANDLTVRQCRLVDHNTAYEMMGNDELEGYASVEWNDLGAYLFDNDINDVDFETEDYLVSFSISPSVIYWLKRN